MNVSICIPTYQRPDLLEEALRSALAQTQPPREILVGDNSADERSERLVREYAAASEVPVRYVRHDPPLGQAGNVEALFQRAEGERLVLLHDDDLLLPGALETLGRCFEERPEVVAAYGKQRLAGHKGQPLSGEAEALNTEYRRHKGLEGVQPSALRAAITQQFPNDGFMVEAAIARRIGYVTEATGSACDFGFGVRLAQSGGAFYYCDEYVMTYRLSEASVLRGDGTHDSSYFSFRLVEAMPEAIRQDEAIRTWLQSKAPAAIMVSAREGRTAEGLRWYVGPYHREQILTLGGARRLLALLNPVNVLKKAPGEGRADSGLRQLLAEMERNGLSVVQEDAAA